MDDESADEVTSDALDVLDVDSVTLLVETSAGVSGGVVTLEAARTSDYSGTWQSMGTITTSAASRTYLLSLSPSNDVSGDAALPVPYIRARISTVLTGGTIDVYIIVRK